MGISYREMPPNPGTPPPPLELWSGGEGRVPAEIKIWGEGGAPRKLKY